VVGAVVCIWMWISWLIDGFASLAVSGVQLIDSHKDRSCVVVSRRLVVVADRSLVQRPSLDSS